MKITVMKQIAVGLQCTSKDKLHKQLDSIKWNLWHGNVDKALDKIDSFSEDFYEEEIDKNSKKYKLTRTVFKDLVSTNYLGMVCLHEFDNSLALQISE